MFGPRTSVESDQVSKELPVPFTSDREKDALNSMLTQSSRNLPRARSAGVAAGSLAGQDRPSQTECSTHFNEVGSSASWSQLVSMTS